MDGANRVLQGYNSIAALKIITAERLAIDRINFSILKELLQGSPKYDVCIKSSVKIMMPDKGFVMVI